MRIVQITRLSWDILVICPKTDTQQQKTNVCLFVSCIDVVVAIQTDNVDKHDHLDDNRKRNKSGIKVLDLFRSDLQLHFS